MKIVFIFKDGLTYTPEPYDSFSLKGEGDFLQRLEQGKETNAPIKFSDHEGNTVHRSYNDLHSIQIIMNQ